MGSKRIADGHPEQYRVKYFELGNEQYNPNYVDQVAAMEAKARELGVGKTLHYMFPMNSFLNDADIAKAVALEPRIDSQLLADLHVGGGGAVGTAEALFQTVRKDTAQGSRLFCVRCASSALDTAQRAGSFVRCASSHEAAACRRT